MALWLAIAVGLLAALAFYPSSAGAEDPLDHDFDPDLSLEGDCLGEDGVADLGCPYQPPPLGPRPFNRPCGAAVDRAGSIYLANPAEGTKNGRIDVFGSDGKFLVEISNEREPCHIAVDSTGALYVVLKKHIGAGQGKVTKPVTATLMRYSPNSFPPGPGVEYTQDAKLDFTVQEPEEPEDPCAEPLTVAVDPSTDHLYIAKRCFVEEYGSAAEGMPLLKCCIGETALPGSGRVGVDVYGRNHDVYATAEFAQFPQPAISRVFIFDGDTEATKCELRGTGLEIDPFTGENKLFPAFEFLTGGAIAVDQADGELYVYDMGHAVVDQFSLDDNGGVECPQYSYTRRLPAPPMDPNPILDPPFVDLVVDGPCRTGAQLDESCDIADYESPNEGEVYISVGGKASDSHLYAFAPRKGGPPEILAQQASEIGENEAVLEAEVSPNSLETTYHFEYTTQADFEANGYTNAISTPVPDANAGKGGAFVTVAAALIDLEQGVSYRFRLVASNCGDSEAEPEECLTVGEGSPGGEGLDASFTTYPRPPSSERGYELVTPPDTGGVVPTMAMLGGEFSFSGFSSTMASPDGESLVFGSSNGSLPGLGGGGYQDTYEARRDPSSGWQSQFTGLSGAQAEKPVPGGIAPEHEFAFWYVFANDRGTLVQGGEEARYLKVPVGTQSTPNCIEVNEPDNRLEWIGCGTMGVDRNARGKWISPEGGHVIFETADQLEGNCAPPGKNAIYDRAPGGATHCVSLLPGEITPSGSANYRGTSADGSVVAFAVDSTLYARLGNAKTVEVSQGSPTFGGIAEDGGRVFYLKGGDVFAFDTAGEVTTQIGSGGESTLAYVSADGSHAYFISPLQLDGSEGEVGKDNLYAWDGATVRFIAVLDPLDIGGEGAFAQGLGHWVLKVLDSIQSPGSGPADVPARSTADGSVFVFESQASLAGYDSGGHRQVYRYDESEPLGQRLQCISCNPTGAPASGAGQLHSPSFISVLGSVNSLTQIANVTEDGERVFFQSTERLVSDDVDGKLDVYEWQALGSGDCQRDGGCLVLVSSPHSSSDESLYAMTPDGSDVFFLSGDRLVPHDPDGSPSIYDARVGGGFPPPVPPNPECLGEACQPEAAAPDDIAPPSASFVGPGDPAASRKGARSCPRGKRLVRRAGKARCVKRQGKKKRQARQRSHGRSQEREGR